MPDVLITKSLLQSGHPKRGGWAKEQMTLLGVRWPLTKDWKQTVLGRRIPVEAARRFVALGGGVWPNHANAASLPANPRIKAKMPVPTMPRLDLTTEEARTLVQVIDSVRTLVVALYIAPPTRK